MWQQSLAKVLAQIPPEVSMTDLIATVRKLRHALHQRCLLCDPSFRPPYRLDYDKFRASIYAEQDIVYCTNAVLLNYFCDTCLEDYDIAARFDYTRQCRQLDENRKNQGREEEGLRRRRQRFEQGTGTPWNDLCVLSLMTSPEESLRLKAIPYRDFLQTRYWQVIRRYVLSRKKQCFLCQASASLNVHHTTYQHHGYEHLHCEDLVVLCKTCHARHHGKLVQETPSIEMRQA